MYNAVKLFNKYLAAGKFLLFDLSHYSYSNKPNKTDAWKDYKRGFRLSIVIVNTSPASYQLNHNFLYTKLYCFSVTGKPYIDMFTLNSTSHIFCSEYSIGKAIYL